MVVPLGTMLKVYWPGHDEWYSTSVVGYRAAVTGLQLKFVHQCEYPSGPIEHDLGEVQFEIVKSREQARLDQENLEQSELNSLEESEDAPLMASKVSVRKSIALRVSRSFSRRTKRQGASGKTPSSQAPPSYS